MDSPPTPPLGSHHQIARGPVAWRLPLLALMINVGALVLLVVLSSWFGFAPASGTPAGAAPGFLRGLWHGLVLPIAFVASFFRPSIGLYAAVHDGHAYDAGFLLGAVITLQWPFARVTRTVHRHHYRHDHGPAEVVR